MPFRVPVDQRIFEEASRAGYLDPGIGPLAAGGGKSFVTANLARAVESLLASTRISPELAQEGGRLLRGKVNGDLVEGWLKKAVKSMGYDSILYQDTGDILKLR